MNKHTPSPWSTQSDPCHYDTLSIVTAGEKMIVHVGGCCEPAEQEANARLIAAAPEMLDFINEFIDAWESGFAGDSYLFHMARDVFAKAKGEV